MSRYRKLKGASRLDSGGGYFAKPVGPTNSCYHCFGGPIPPEKFQCLWNGKELTTCILVDRVNKDSNLIEPIEPEADTIEEEPHV